MKTPNVQYRVNLIESERGWGQRIDEIRYFTTELKAKKFVEDFNSKNNQSKVPDWYMYAVLVGWEEVKKNG